MRVPLVLVAVLFAAGAAVPPSQMPPLPPPPPTRPVVVDDVPMTPPDVDPQYSPQTEATIEWLDDVEDARLQAKAQDPPAVLQAPGAPRGDGIQHCIGADGSVVFTDRGCAELGATDAPPPGAADAEATHFAPKSCARTRGALVDGVRDALDARDENRLASYYHWTGMGTRAAYDLMDRLHGFVERPLVDVQLARSEPRRDPYALDSAVPPLWSPLLPPPPPARPRAPDLVRVDQMRGQKDVASEVTYFHLTPNAGCWWIEF
jgi:hypothetical protein